MLTSFSPRLENSQTTLKLKQQQKKNKLKNNLYIFATYIKCSQEIELVSQVNGRLRVEGLASEECQLVGILAWCRHTNSARPIPIQVAHLEGQPG